MHLFRSAASWLLLALVFTSANAAPDPRPVHVDMMETCHKGLVIWHRFPPKLVRDSASEARITHVAAPPRGSGWVTYYGSKDCEPCVRHLAMFRAEVMPKLEPGTMLTVFDIGAPGE